MGGRGKSSGLSERGANSKKTDADLAEWQSVYQSVRNTGPFVTDVSQKQVGVIYLNAKKGNIDLPQDDIKILYNQVVGSGIGRYKQDNHMLEDANIRIRMGIEYLFRGKYKEAEKEIKNGLKYFK